MLQSHIFAICICLMMTQAYVLHLLWSCKKEMQSKNVRLIQFYLDMKFMSKGLNDSLGITNTTEFCYKLMEDIKDYFSLDDIIIVDSLRMAKDEKNTPLRRSAIEFTKRNSPKIKKLLTKSSFFTLDFVHDNEKYTLYITSITPDIVNDGLIIAVESHPILLSKNELISLENIVNLLKNRLMYS